LIICSLKSQRYQEEAFEIGSADCTTFWFRFSRSSRVLSSLLRRYLRRVEMHLTRISRTPSSDRHRRQTGCLTRWHIL